MFSYDKDVLVKAFPEIAKGNEESYKAPRREGEENVLGIYFEEMAGFS